MTDDGAKSDGGSRGRKLRMLVLGVNLTVALFFAIFFTATWMAPKHLVDLARNFAIDKTIEFATPHANRLEELLKDTTTEDSPKGEAVESVREEVERYQADPRAYMNKLVDEAPSIPEPDTGRNLADIIQSFTKDPVATFRIEARAYYDDTIAALLRDLRIFSGANVIAALVAALVAYFARKQRLIPLVWFALLMLAALGYTIYLYVDNMTFFTILTRTHMGWFYPILLVIATLELLWKHGRVGFGLREVFAHEKEPT